MKKQKAIYVVFMVVFLVLVSSSVYAACDADRCLGKIDRLYMQSGTLYISTDGDETLLDCNAPAGVYITIPTSNPEFKNLYAMMLTSMSLNNTIGLRIANGSESCSLVYTYMDN